MFAEKMEASLQLPDKFKVFQLHKKLLISLTTE